MSVRLSYHYVAECFQSEGCRLLSKEYKNNQTQLDYACKCGNRSTISFANFKSGKRCRRCGSEKRAQKQRLSFDYVKNFFTEQDCILLVKEYVNNLTKMPYTCSCGNHAEISFGKFQMGQRCKSCRGEKIGNVLRPSFLGIEKKFADEGCQLLAKEYKNAHTKMSYICSCGRKACIDMHHFNRGQRCEYCAIKKRSGENHFNWNPNLDEGDRANNRNRGSKFTKWSKTILVRDNYICQNCGNTSCRLNAHHLNSWSYFPKLRYELSNGITLCVGCHTEFHTQYGYKATREQFETWRNQESKLWQS